MVTEVAKRVPLYNEQLFQGSFYRVEWLAGRLTLTRISPYLLRGEGVWCESQPDGYIFLDMDTDLDQHPEGPPAAAAVVM